MPVADKLTHESAGVKKTPPSPKRKTFIPSDDSVSDNQTVLGWNKLKQAAETDLLVFKLTKQQTVRMEWSGLSEAVQTAFQDVLHTVTHKGETFDTETEGECFVFGFSDECVQLSAICTVLNGKIAFFFKEEESGNFSV